MKKPEQLDTVRSILDWDWPEAQLLSYYVSNHEIPKKSEQLSTVRSILDWDWSEAHLLSYYQSLS